jgi:adenosylcobinamide-GDP ribazoletransferase
MAIRLLTCLPVPRSAGATPGRLVGSLVWFPVVGAGLGAALGLAELAVRSITGSHVAACGLVVALSLLLTQGRPVRGLMVLTGALFGGRESEALAQLAARRWPTRFGLLVGIAALMLKYALLMALPGDGRLGALVLAGGLSRAAIVWVCWRFPYADIDTGIGGWFVALAGPRDLLLVLPVVAVGCVVLGPVWAPAAIAGAWLLAHGFAFWIARALSGLTAHACEATAEVGELGALSALALLASTTSLPHWFG